MFISEVFSASTTGSASSFGSSFANFIPLVLIVLVFYFFIIRPHQKRLKEIKRMIDQVKRGDTVATSGGIIGVVNKVDEVNSQFFIEVAPKVEIKILKSAISQVLNKNDQTKLCIKSKTDKDDKKMRVGQTKTKKIQDNNKSKSS